MQSLKISIIIPVKPGGHVQALQNLSRLIFPPDQFEIIVAEGRRPSTQRNRAAVNASGDIVYFLDDDSLVEPGCLTRLYSHYEADAPPAAVGGPSLTPAGDSPLQRAIGKVFTSRFGGGINRNRYRQEGRVRECDDSELILCNLSFRKDVFLQFGGLDERLYPNEENELLHRLKSAGLPLIHDPELAVMRSQRPSFAAFVRQIFGYGRGRGEQIRISKEIKFFTFVPSLFILYLLFLPIFFSPIYATPLFFYLCLVLYSAFFERQNDELAVIFLKTILFPTLHLCYGSGLVTGIVRPRFRGAATDMGNVKITIIKSMKSN